MIRPSVVFLLGLLACGAPAEPAAPAAPAAGRPSDAGPLPSSSLYQLHPKLTDQHGTAVSLDVHAGHPVIVSMFYASCPNACPTLIRDIRKLEDSLAPADRADLRVLLVSLDPDRDTPEKLTEVAAQHGLDGARWTLTRAENDDVRQIAAALGIRYRSTADGGMNHSSLMTLLDVRGRPIARLEGLNRDASPLREALVSARAPVPETH